MIELDDELLAGDGFVRLSATMQDKKGSYYKAKLYEDELWINLKITNNENLQKILDTTIDQAVVTWLHDQHQKNYIEIPKIFLRELYLLR